MAKSRLTDIHLNFELNVAMSNETFPEIQSR